SRVVHEGVAGREAAEAGALPGSSARGGEGDPGALSRGVGGGGSGMTTDRIRRLLEEVAAGVLAPGAALERLAWLPVEEVGGEEAGSAFARLDHHRALRQGYPEVVFCPGKTPEQVVEICRRLAARGEGFLATRADEAVRAALAEAFPTAEVNALGR